MAEVMNGRSTEYGGRVAHDANGVGEAVGEHLTGEDVIHFRKWQGPPRIKLFSRYIRAVERGEVLLPRSEPWYRAHRYLTNADLYGSGHPPDEFVACALAYYAATGGDEVEMALVSANAPRAETAEQAGAREQQRKAAAAAVVTERIKQTGVYWPDGGGGRR
jgi:hypothetical protein